MHQGRGGGGGGNSGTGTSGAKPLIYMDSDDSEFEDSSSEESDGVDDDLLF